jgi:thymidylate synthase (FAD)
MSNQIKVLDHGFVRLVDHMGSDLSIVRAARVSYDAAWRAGENEGSDKKLIDYLWKNRHTTPFEAVEFQFEVMAPIFVLRQWHRHRTWTYNELSGRYRELPETYYLPDPENIGEQAVANKQGRQPGGDLEARRAEVEKLRAGFEAAFATYRELQIKKYILK